MNRDENLARPDAGEHLSNSRSHLSITNPRGAVLGSPAHGRVLTKYKSLNLNMNQSSFHGPTSGGTPSHATSILGGSDTKKPGRVFSQKSSFSGASPVPGGFVPEPPAQPKHPSKTLSQSMARLPDLSRRNEKPPMPAQMMYTIDGSEQSQGVPRVEPSKVSTKKIGIVKAYAANTHQGIIRFSSEITSENRNYNEDRVAIILNIIKPANKKTASWPKCALFGIYDGHGGAACADFLRDSLHHIVLAFHQPVGNPRACLPSRPGPCDDAGVRPGRTPVP